MSEKKLTPAEAWEHVKALWPGAVVIDRRNDFSAEVRIARPELLDFIYFLNGNIDWPSGVDRWPPIEKPRRPAKMPGDYGRPAWFCDDAIDEKTHGTICGQLPSEEWIDEEGLNWNYAEVECDDPKPSQAKPNCPAQSEPMASLGPEPEWITPTEEHIGQMVQVRDDAETEKWESAGNWELVRIVPGEFPFHLSHTKWRFARIRNPKYKG